MSEQIKTLTWTATTGQTKRVDVTLTTQDTADADGYQCTVGRTRIEITAYVDNRRVGANRPTPVSHPEFVAAIGHLGLDAERLAQVTAAIAEIEAAPEWQAHLEAVAARDAGNRKYEAGRERMHAVMGY